MRKEGICVGMDIGTSKICVVVSSLEKGERKIIGLGYAPVHEGLRKGVVINIENTVKAIEEAIKGIQPPLEIKIKEVVVSLGGVYLKGHNAHGSTPVTRGSKEITRTEIKAVIDNACALSLPENEKIIYVFPQEYIVDNNQGIKEPPLGLSGEHLELRTHLITGAPTSMQNVIKCVNLAGYRVLNFIPAPLASAFAVLASEEMDGGVAFLDLGAGTSDLLIFFKGSLMHSKIFGLGGEEVTNDIAAGMRTYKDKAEEVKRKYGCSFTSLVKNEEVIEVPGLGDRPAHSYGRHFLAEIMEARMEEIFNLVKIEIKNSGYSDLLSAGLVLGGAVAQTPGIKELAEEICKIPVRIAQVRGIEFSEDFSAGVRPADLSCSAGIGLLQASPGSGFSTFAKGTFFTKVKKWMKEAF